MSGDVTKAVHPASAEVARAERSEPSASSSAGDVASTPDVSVIVVNYNTARLLPKMRAALERSRSGLRLQLLIVDNASRDDSVALLRRDFGDAQLIFNEKNVGFGRANNQALALASGRHVLLLNTDAFVAPDTLGKTVKHMDAHPDCGVLGVRLVGRNGELQPSCRYFPTPWNVFLARAGLARFFPRTRMVDDMAWEHDSVRECDWVVGCYYLIRREVIDQVGLFDPRYFLYCEEVDHCKAVKRAGWKVAFFPDTQVVHLGGESAEGEGSLTQGRQISALQIESELLYFRKHHGLRGALASTALALTADAVLLTKSLFRRRGIDALRVPMEHSFALLRSVLNTRLGSRPTR